MGRWPPGVAQAQAAAAAQKVSSQLAGPDLVCPVQPQQKESTPEWPADNPCGSLNQPAVCSPDRQHSSHSYTPLNQPAVLT